MKQCGEDYVYLDVMYKDLEEIKKYFFNIYKKCFSLGIDIIKDYIFVVLVVYYLCGGIKVDLDGQSSINCLYVIGECLCIGLYGGNCLVFNLLIEVVVYVDVVVKYVLNVFDWYDFNEDIFEWNDEGIMNNEEWVLII